MEDRRSPRERGRMGTSGAEVVERVLGDGRGAGEAEARFLEADRGFGLGGHELPREEREERRGALGVHLRRRVRLAERSFAPRGDLLLEAFDLAALRLNRLRELLPHARHGEEHRRLRLHERPLQRPLHRVRRGEVNLGREPVIGEVRHRRVNVHDLRGDVRKREVRHDAERAGDEVRVVLDVRARRERHVVVRDHHRLRVARGPGRVDERAAVPGFLVGDARVEIRLGDARAERHEVVPRVHLRLPRADAVVRGLVEVAAVDDDRGELRERAADREDLVELLLALNDDDPRLAVIDDVLARGRLVRGVDPRGEPARGDRGHVREVPLRGVEPEDADGLEAAEAEGDERLGGRARVVVELLPGPRLAVAADERLRVGELVIGALLEDLEARRWEGVRGVGERDASDRGAGIDDRIIPMNEMMSPPADEAGGQFLPRARSRPRDRRGRTVMIVSGSRAATPLSASLISAIAVGLTSRGMLNGACVRRRAGDDQCPVGRYPEDRGE
eukprot:30629-Pelagococcus_subviridis.AAC.3